MLPLELLWFTYPIALVQFLSKKYDLFLQNPFPFFAIFIVTN